MKGFLLFIWLLGCHSAVQEKQHDNPEPLKEKSEQAQDKTSQKVELLRKYYQETKTGVEGAGAAFFKHFPNTYKELNAIYGYDLDKGPMPLYNYGKEHVWELFFELKESIGATRFFDKTFKIAIDGYWQADAISYFQERMRESVEADLDMAMKELSKFQYAQISSIWRFYFDGEYPKSYQKDYDGLLPKVKALNSRIATLLEKSFTKLLSDRS